MTAEVCTYEEGCTGKVVRELDGLLLCGYHESEHVLRRAHPIEAPEEAGRRAR